MLFVVQGCLYPAPHASLPGHHTQGKEAVIAARRRETTGRRQVREAAKKRRAHPEKDDDAKKSSNQADHEGEEDDEVEELDLDVIEAVAGRPLGDEDEARGVGAVREKLSKKAARRAARRVGRTPRCHRT